MKEFVKKFAEGWGSFFNEDELGIAFLDNFKRFIDLVKIGEL